MEELILPSTRNFDQLSREARQSPVRVERIDAAKKRALEELADHAEVASLRLSPRNWPGV